MKMHYRFVDFNYVCQVNGVKLADMLLSLLSVCPSVRTQSSLEQCSSSYRLKAIKLYKSGLSKLINE